MTLVLGTRGGRSVGLDAEQRSRHLHVLGASGTGKSKFLESMIRQDILAGRGLCLIDPHGTLADDIVDFCASRNIEKYRRVHIIEPGAPEWTVGFNPLRLDGSEDPKLRIDTMVDACAEVWGGESMDETPLLATCLQLVFYALAVQRLTLVEAIQLTRSSDPEGFRKALTERLPDYVYQSYWDDFRSLPRREFEERFSSTRRRLLRFLGSAVVRRILGQQARVLDARCVMDEGDILIVNLAQREGFSKTSGRLLGALLASEFYVTALGRPRDVARRRPFYLYIDECYDFLTGDIEHMLDETRKFGLHLILGHHRLAQLRRRVIATDTQGFDGSTIRVASSYDDPTGRLSTTSRPYFLSGGTPKNTQYSYDVLNRLTLVTFPDTSETSYCYHGLITSTTNDKGQTKTVAKNYQGWAVSVIDNASAACSTTGGVATSFAYDAFGDPLTVTEPGSHTITNVFDIRGRKTSSTDPDMGHWTYVYDQLGELLTQTDANSHATTLTYDTLQRPTTRTESGFFSKWLYDTTNGIGYLQNACVNATCGSGNYQQKPTYDSLSRIATGKLILDGTTYTYTPSYDTATGRLATLGYPSGFVAKYIYNTSGYLSQIQDNATGAALWTANTADAELHLTQQTAGNAVTTNESFDSGTGNLTTICASTGPVGCTVANFTYQWDTIGNLTQRKDPTRYTESFCYDGLNRVTNYALGTSCTGSGTTTVTYDDSGNITEKTDICSTSNCFQYGSGAGPHALTSIVGTYNGITNPSFAYDNNGNMTGGGGQTIGVTSFNMASSIAQGSTSVTLAYGTWHERYKTCTPDCTSPITATYYLADPATGGMSEKLISGSTITWTDYIAAPGTGLVAVRSKTSSTVSLRYVVTDHLGSVTSVSDTGTPIGIEHDSYNAWGLRRNANGTGAACGTIASQLTRGYTGQEMLDSLCLINMNARIYDPQLGRFLSGDSFVPDPLSSQNYNRYSYVVNNPLTLVDPSGNKQCEGAANCRYACTSYCSGSGPMPCWDCYGPGFDSSMGGYIANYDWASDNRGGAAGYYVAGPEDGAFYRDPVTGVDTMVAQLLFVQFDMGIYRGSSDSSGLVRIAANDNIPTTWWKYPRNDACTAASYECHSDAPPGRNGQCLMAEIGCNAAALATKMTPPGATKIIGTFPNGRVILMPTGPNSTPYWGPKGPPEWDSDKHSPQ